MSEQAIHLLLDAQSLNARQARLNAHQELLIGRAAGLVARLKTSSLSAHQAALVDESVRLLREFWKANLSERDANEAERECQRTLAGIVDGAPAHKWTIRRSVRVLRVPLADVSNPIVTGARREAAFKVVRDFIEAAPDRLLDPACASLRHELGCAKFTLLHELIADYRAVSA